MSDLLFICPKCSKNLVIDEHGAGASIKCPDCQTVVVVPKPTIFFKCPGCKCDLSAPHELNAKVRGCPICQKELIISASKAAKHRLSCPNCTTDLLLDIDNLAILTNGATINCINCNESIEITSENGHIEIRNTTRISAGTGKLRLKEQEPSGTREKSKCLKITHGIAAEARGKYCPACQTRLSVDAVICITCGMDLRTGRKIKQASAHTTKDNHSKPDRSDEVIDLVSTIADLFS